MSGWVAFSRKLHDHPLFHKRPDRVYVWTWMLAQAAWRDTKIDIDGQMTPIKRGQFAASQATICAATGMTRKELRTFLNTLKSEGAVKTHPGSKRANSKAIITICNYDKYQNAGPMKGQSRANEGPIKEQGNKDITLEPDGSNGADAPKTVEVSVLSKAVWDAGKPFLSSRGVDNPGAMIGRWLKSHSPLEVLAAIEAAQKAGTQDPVPYIVAALKPVQAQQPDVAAIFADLKREGRI